MNFLKLFVTCFFVVFYLIGGGGLIYYTPVILCDWLGLPDAVGLIGLLIVVSLCLAGAVAYASWCLDHA